MVEAGDRKGDFRFGILLLTLAAAILLPPYFYGFAALAWIWETCITLVMLAALYSVAGRKEAMFWLVVLLVPASISSWLPLFSDAHIFAYADNLFTIFYFALVAYHLARYIQASDVVTANVIYAALSLYMIVAVVWGGIYNLQFVHDSNAFAFSSDALTQLANDPRTHASLFNYYSFVTLSTLGYGDVVPLTPATQAWASVEAMFGQFYLAVTIARLVGIYSSGQPQNTATSKS